MFLIIVLSVWAAVHGYVFWRVSSVPLFATHLWRRGLVVLALALWASYPLARILNARHWDLVGRPLEFAGATWIGTLFLAFSALLVVDVVTVGGLLVPRLAPALRGWTLAGGHYLVDGMPVIVCRGTGTWGPRMRLWRPGEIIRIKLRAPA